MHEISTEINYCYGITIIIIIIIITYIDVNADIDIPFFLAGLVAIHQV